MGAGFRIQESGVRSRRRSMAVGCRRWLAPYRARRALVLGLSMATVLVFVGGAVSAATFDEQRAAMRGTVQTQPEAAIMSLLQAGLDEGKAVPAIAEAQKWLRQNLPAEAMLLYHAGRAAELSGDWKSAVSLYQQYLKKADRTSDTADEAVYAVYTLLIERLQDTAAAYAFSRTEGDRLMVCPRARQFDTWFLDQAVQRKDAAAVANRLHACIEAGLPSDLLIARYDNYFWWLLSQTDGYCNLDPRVTQDLYDAVKELSAAMTFMEEMKLRLDWAVSVRAYNQAMIGDETGKPVERRGRGGRKRSQASNMKVAGTKIRKADREAAQAGAAVEQTLELDGDAPPPIAEATALLEKYPRNAKWVQDGWLGVGAGGRDNHPNNVGDQKKYWPNDVEAKMAPIVAAIPKLTPLQRAELLNSWRPDYYARQAVVPRLLDIRSVRDYLRANPELTNSRTGVLVLEKPWHSYSPEEALALAPRIANIADRDASYIRAYAAGITRKDVTHGDKTRTEYAFDFDKVMAALLGPEAWRLGTRIDMHSAGGYNLHTMCGKPGGAEKTKEFGDKMAVIAAQIKAEEIKPDAPAAQRIAAFRKLWDDYRAPQPKITAVYERLTAILQSSPEVIPELLKDPGPEAQILARDAIASGMTGPDPMWKELDWRKDLKTSHYDPLMRAYIERHRGMAQIKQQYPNKCKPHPLEDELRMSLAEGVKQNTLRPWQVLVWINMQWPEDNAEQVQLMQAMFTSPAWKTMPFEVQFAAREWFKQDAMTAGQVAWVDAANPKIVCKDLLALPKEADAAATVDALSKTIDGVRKSPVQMQIQGLDQLAAVTNAVFTDSKVMNQILEVTDGLRYTSSSEEQPFGDRLYAYVNKLREPVLVHRTAACLWQYGASGSRGRMFEPMKTLTRALIEPHPAAAGALARTAVESLSHRRSIYGFNPATRVPEMKALAGKAAMKMGLVVVPVARNHPAYPIYKSQADWMTANEDTAWTMLDESWEQLLPVHRDLSVEYLMWVLQRTIYGRDDARMEELVKALLAWAGEAGSPWSTEQQIDLEIAYGDIALQLGQLENAHKIFVKIQQNEAYESSMAKHKATLRRVTVERIAKRFDDALKTLSDLDMERIPELWVASRYARAEVYYDMEEFDEAANDIAAILAREPDHSEAKIMQGKVQIRRQKLMEASELDVGSKNAKHTLVPGDNLKVTLIDPTLAVSGAGTEIEVVVWATSGDREHFFLRQFGDQKTKFRGEVRTALGKPSPDDDVLQVIGDDEIYYAYSERFRKKMNDMEEKRGGPITVRSDAVLMASARKLLSEAEQRVADMEAKMAEIAKGGRVTTSTAAAAQVMAAREAAEKGRTREDRKAAEERETAELTKALLQARVKPGKAINVRVIDPDRSRTAEIDEVTVSIESSSGDSIGRITLKETGTHTGWFEGSVPTAGAQAMAFAADTEPGRNPNMVISPTPGYPAWRPTAVKGKTPEFKIDLNDNVTLGEMTIKAAEPGARLKKFVLQTGMSAQDMTTVAVYPKDQLTLDQPWHPSVTIMNDTDDHHVRNDRSVYDIRELEEQLERGWITQAYAQGVAENVAGPSAAMTNSIPGKVKWLRQNRHDTSHVIYRFRGYFYEPSEVTRRFQVVLGKYQIPKTTHPSINHPAQFMLAVDGRPITDKAKPAKLEGELYLRPGLHRFELWATGWSSSVGFGRSVKLLANLAGPETLGECPESFFDPATFPKGVLPHRNRKATITANAEGTRFNVTFAPGSQTRLLNLVLLGQEGPVPALNTITLTQPGGARVLPVAEDFATLNKNNTLEILTGDKVAVRYVDDRFVNKAKENHERTLHVSFSDASFSFVFVEMRLNRNQEMEPYYERLLRFTHGQPLYLKIEDTDMDMTDAPDTVKVVLESRSGGKKTFVAKETGPSTALFLLAVIPVPGTPSQDNEFQVAAGETITATYRDEENVRPGVPADRYASVAHAVFSVPTLRLSHASVTPIDDEALKAEARPGKRGLTIGFATLSERHALRRNEAAEGLLKAEESERATGGLIRPRWSISNSWAEATSPPEGGIAVVHGQMMFLEIEAPHLALRSGSSIAVYVQTDAGRGQGSLLGGSLDEEATEPAFDIGAPGTMKLEADLIGRPGGGGMNREGIPPQIPIYVPGYLGRSDGRHWTAMSTEVFGCSVPLIAGFLPEEGVLSAQEIERRRERKLPLETKYGLVVRPGEKVHVGIRYTDESGVERWLTGSARVITHPVLDVMTEDYREEKQTAYAGEALHLRVVDLGADVSDASDTVSVLMQAKSGAKHRVDLLEVDTHSGVFQADVELSYAQPQDEAAGNPEYNVKREGFPVVYGDTMGVRYTDANGVQTDTAMLTICKGADGTIWPFSKKYDDPDVAMRTQFSLAEAYLEMAKRHRKLGETERANHEYERAKDMLEKAMDMFRDPDTRAHAEYLLGNLTQEEADTTEAAELKEDRYRAALSRYMRVTGSYPDTLYASKAQFKIATVYEQMNEPEIAAQEYVKLAYKYPDSEFLALAMARLGTHFQRKAAQYETQAKELLAKTEDKDAQFDGKAMETMYIKEYIKSAEIFGRLLERFPDHELAGASGLRGGQAFMRAGENRDALNAFKRVFEHEAYDGPKIRSQAMYWAGMCYESLGEDMAAYSVYKRLTFDFPESKWASFARGQLSTDRLLTLEENLEIKRVEEGR